MCFEEKEADWFTKQHRINYLPFTNRFSHGSPLTFFIMAHIYKINPQDTTDHEGFYQPSVVFRTPLGANYVCLLDHLIIGTVSMYENVPCVPKLNHLDTAHTYMYIPSWYIWDEDEEHLVINMMLSVITSTTSTCTSMSPLGTLVRGWSKYHGIPFWHAEWFATCFNGGLCSRGSSRIQC